MASQLQCESSLSSCTSNNGSNDDDAAVEMASPACYRGIIPNVNGYADDGFDRFLEQKEHTTTTLQAEHQHDTSLTAMTYSASSEQDSCNTRDGMDAVDDDDDDGFGDFEEFSSHVVFNTVDEAIDQWKTILAKVFPETRYEDWAGNDMTSIRRYVLEEAHESIHSRISWTAVTHAMDDDTGVPKVRWNHSKIEDMYLSALNCKRQKDPVPLVPSTLTITGEADRDDTPISSPPPMTAPSTFPDTHTQQQQQQPTTPSSARSSFFSFARFLPRLSTSSLPRSDSSAPTSASSTIKRSSMESHSRISEGTGCTSPPSPEIASNSNPLSKPVMHIKSSTTKRHSMPAPATAMKINTSLANQTLLDLDDDDGVTITSPPAARSLFSFTPLTPTAVHTPTKTTIQKDQDFDDDFGDFEQATADLSSRKNNALDEFTITNTTLAARGNDHENDFGDFIQSQDTIENSNDDDWGEWSSA